MRANDQKTGQVYLDASQLPKILKSDLRILLCRNTLCQ